MARSEDRSALVAIAEEPEEVGGYIPFEREATDLLFQLISARYERRSIALHTNLNIERSLKCLGID